MRNVSPANTDQGKMLTSTHPTHRHVPSMNLFNVRKHSPNHQFVHSNYKYLCSSAKRYHFKNARNESPTNNNQNKMLPLTHPRARHVPSMGFFKLCKHKKKLVRAQTS